MHRIALALMQCAPHDYRKGRFANRPYSPCTHCSVPTHS